MSEDELRAVEKMRDYTLDVIRRIHEFNDDGQRDILWMALGRVATDLSNLAFKSYGIVGDGITDDAPAFQAVIGRQASL